MTLEQLAGQLLWAGWGTDGEPSSRTYTDHTRFLVEELGVGGIVVFDRNLGSADEVRNLTRELHERAGRPVLIGIDQEGGRVARLSRPGITFPGNRALGAIDDLSLTRQVSRAIGEQLITLGINVDFAPDLDVNNNPRNPIIGVRSFGEEPEKVARHGVSAVAGLLDGGVIPVVKHFPGHGDTSTDSHLELPVLNVTRERLDAVELVPFRAAIQAGAPAVMTTHILFPFLDPDLPATLSRRILTGILRDELGFDGVVITDCMQMAGITDRWGPEEAAILAVEAGTDMLAACHSQDVQARMHRALCDAVRSGRITEERLQRSAERIRLLHTRLAATPAATHTVGSTAYCELERRVAADSLSLVGGKIDGTGLPDGWSREVPVTVTGAPTEAASLAGILRDQGIAAETAPWTRSPRSLRGRQLVWVALPDNPFPDGHPSPEVHSLLKRHPKAVVVAAREHYCLADYPGDVPRLAAWGSREPNLRAVARWLAGEIRPRPLALGR
jgi:beta-N-acetylhexosaminidase